MNKMALVLKWLFILLVAALAIVAAFHFDEIVRNWIFHHRNRVVSRLMQDVSKFGDWPEHLFVGLSGAAIAYWRGNKRWARICLTMIAALAIAGVIGHG